MPPPLPGYDLARVIELRDRIFEASQIHVGTVLLGEYHEDWLAMVHSAISDVPLKALQLSTRSFLGRMLTDERLREFAWLVAGNLKRLRDGHPVVAWGMQAEEEWMPLYVVRASQGRNRRDEPGHWLTFRFMAGSACPTKVRRFWSRAQARFIATLMGFNARRKRHFNGAEHFVGMLLYGLVEPRLSEDRPGFHQIRVPDTMLRHNVALIDGRREKPCPAAPFHYLHGCDVCTIGYDRCPLAMHPRTYVRGKCADCGEPEAVIDPDRPERCVACDHKRDTRSSKE